MARSSQTICQRLTEATKLPWEVFVEDSGAVVFRTPDFPARPQWKDDYLYSISQAVYNAMWNAKETTGGMRDRFHSAGVLNGYYDLLKPRGWAGFEISEHVARTRELIQALGRNAQVQEILAPVQEAFERAFPQRGGPQR